MATAGANPLVVSLDERLRALRDGAAVPPSLLDVELRRVGGAYLARPRDWEALREDEALARRGVPYWARLWPSGEALAAAVAAGPPLAGRRVLELGCGLGLPSVAAARAGGRVLATDASTDAVVFAAHNLALNELAGDVAVASWARAGGALADGGPWDLVLAADVLYLNANVEALLRLLPRLVGDGGEAWIADPDRSGARDFLTAARKRFVLRSQRVAEGVSLHRLAPRQPAESTTAAKRGRPPREA
jgi:predicted nicotinamide N-methyase